MSAEQFESGCMLIDNKVFVDERGYFTELYRKSKYDYLPEFKQTNLSRSKQGVVRGMHFQTHNPQGKLVRVLEGTCIDVVVDLRKGDNYGQVDMYLLMPHTSSLYVPPGFAHSFWALTDLTFLYYCTEEYDPSSDGGINPLDSSMGYPWQGADTLISDKDLALPMFKDFISPFEEAV